MQDRAEQEVFMRKLFVVLVLTFVGASVGGCTGGCATCGR
jgi:hypothetical protein